MWGVREGVGLGGGRGAGGVGAAPDAKHGLLPNLPRTNAARARARAAPPPRANPLKHANTNPQHPRTRACRCPPPPPKLDSWSAGALAYDVLCGRAPFALREGLPRDEEAGHILGSDPEFPSGLSYNAFSFMMQVGGCLRGGLTCWALFGSVPCGSAPALPPATLGSAGPANLPAPPPAAQALEKCPQKRPSVRQLLAHPWFEKPREQPTPAAGKRRSRSASSGTTTSSGGGGGGAVGTQ